MEPEDIIFSEIGQSVDPDFNIPQSQEFVVGKRGKIHIRTTWPKGDVRGVVFYVHGYNSHISRPAHRHISAVLASGGFGYCGIDLYGHGYSDGSRGVVDAPVNIVESVVEAISAIYANSTSSINCSINFQRTKIQPETPLFLVGQSMGGAVVTLVAKTLNDHVGHIVVKGIILLCPAIGIPPPPLVVRFILDNLIVPLFPQDSVPSWMSSSLADDATWSNEHYIRYIKHDRSSENPSALCWGKSIRFESAAHILQLSESASKILPTVELPILIFHDPDDKVVHYSCSENVIASTKSLLHNKKIINVENGLHDLISNKTGFIASQINNWLDNFFV